MSRSVAGFSAIRMEMGPGVPGPVDELSTVGRMACSDTARGREWSVGGPGGSRRPQLCRTTNTNHVITYLVYGFESVQGRVGVAGVSRETGMSERWRGGAECAMRTPEVLRFHVKPEGAHEKWNAMTCISAGCAKGTADIPGGRRVICGQLRILPRHPELTAGRRT